MVHDCPPLTPPQLTVMRCCAAFHSPTQPVRCTVPRMSEAPLKLPSALRLATPLTAPATWLAGVDTKCAAHRTSVPLMHWGASLLKSPQPPPLAFSMP